MRTRLSAVWLVALFTAVLLLAGPAQAQFTGNIEGVVTDPSGGTVASGKVTLVNVATSVSASTTSDASGYYRFLSLAPGDYKIRVEASGFSASEATIHLEYNQTLNLPMQLKVGAATEAITVTSEAPLLNTSETRNQLTLETRELNTLPLAGRSMISLVTLAPGVSGLGTQTSNAPGSGVDNYSTETAVDVSANGQGTVANMWIVDGLDATSAIRQGVVNLTPNPDNIQEATTEVNTFNVEYGRASSIQFAMTTKSGADQWHGLASDYFNYQPMYAKYSLPGSDHEYAPFHSNNISANIGGPIIPHHQFFFFFGIEPLRSLASTGNQSITFPDAAFATFAANTFPNTFGTKILNSYTPSGATIASVAKTAADIFPTTCGTVATFNLPCATPMIDNGVFNSSNFRNGDQYFVRVDKYFGKDRIYGSFFRTLLHYGGPNVIPQFSTTNHTTQRAFQVNWTHTFSPTTFNEAIFAQNRIEGFLGETGDFTIPNISVTGQSVGYGVGFAQGDFIQHNYHWRDVLTHVRGAHVLKVGYEGWFGDDVEPFQGPWSHPNFNFDNLLTLAQDAPLNEGNVMYNPITGQQQLWSWNAASKTWGLFVQDTWKARRNLTLTLGFRYDDQGNPYSRSDTTVFGNFYLGQGSTFQDQVAGGVATPTSHALKHTPRAYQPRIGAAWDINGKGDWVLRGGFGMYSNWLTPANIQEEFRGNPPGLILPTFVATNAPANRPIFTQGSGDKPPWGFTFPALAGTTLCPVAPCLDAAGGIPGAGLTIGGIDPNIVSPTTYIFAATLEHRLGSHLVGSILYSGSHSQDLVSAGNQSGTVNYGQDINALPGGLIGLPPGSLPNRLNPSFGQILYTANDRYGNYNGVTFDVRGRFRRAFFDASYTRSKSKDDAGLYPTAIDPGQFYGPSPWDVPDRFSLNFNYQLPGMNGGQGFVGKATGGWGVSGTSIYQSGYPFTVFTDASFTGGGDYNADGDNLDYPDAGSYHQSTSKNAFLTGIFAPGQFTAPTVGTNGNEKVNEFRGPHFVQTDMTIYKDTHITERLNFQFRFEFYNLFNHPNFQIQHFQGDDQASGNFGKVTYQSLPRWWQIGAKITF
jgi:Carboxypeptidase regulatory-like domain/TonB dependent receptor